MCNVCVQGVGGAHAGVQQCTFIWYSFYHLLCALYRVLQLQAGAQELVPGEKEKEGGVKLHCSSPGVKICCHGYSALGQQENDLHFLNL